MKESLCAWGGGGEGVLQVQQLEWNQEWGPSVYGAATGVGVGVGLSL